VEFANAISVSQTLGNAIGFQLAVVPCPVCGSDCQNTFIC